MLSKARILNAFDALKIVAPAGKVVAVIACVAMPVLVMRKPLDTAVRHCAKVFNLI